MKLKTSILTLKDDFKIARNMTLPIEQTLQITHKDISEDYERLNDILQELILINKYAEKIKK